MRHYFLIIILLAGCADSTFEVNKNDELIGSGGSSNTDDGSNGSGGGSDNNGGSSTGGSDNTGGSDAGSVQRTCSDLKNHFTVNVWPIINTSCMACHKSGGTAENQNSNFILSSSELDSGFTDITSYANLANQQLIAKISDSGVGHGGGTLYSSTANETLQFEHLINNKHLVDEGSCSNYITSNLSDAINVEPVDVSLRKAALLIAGRLPTDEEYLQVTDEATLKVALRALMTGPGFDDFLMESANNQLLTNKYRSKKNSSLAQLDRYAFPLLEQRYEDDGRSEASLANTIYAIAEEPLRLISHVVKNERPYSEILTADYIMVNGYSSLAYQGDQHPSDLTEYDDWREGNIYAYHFLMPNEISQYESLLPENSIENGHLPNAGILSSPMFLARYPTTATNRNRARARWAYQFFLGVDIEGLAQRAMDPEELKTVTNPNTPGSSCYGCHLMMDPVAGAFQNWGDLDNTISSGHFLDVKSITAIDRNYQTTVDGNQVNGFEAGDRWYRDNLAPGFESIVLQPNNPYKAYEGSTYTDPLQWLAHKIVEDERFITGTVKFWYPAIFGEKMLNPPQLNSDAGFNEITQVYLHQQEQLNFWATNFATNLNLKDLLVDMLMSKEYRALQVADGTNEFYNVGKGTLLTPEQLNRKMLAVFGEPYTNTRFDDRPNRLLGDYNLMFGGIDSDMVTQRMTTVNTMMMQVTNRMGNEFTCRYLFDQFLLPANERFLFKGIELTDVPLMPTRERIGRDEIYNRLQVNPQGIQQQIVDLYWVLFGKQYELDHVEITSAYQLFLDVWHMRINDDRFGSSVRTSTNIVENEPYEEYCQLPNSNLVPDMYTTEPFLNPQQTFRSWSAVLMYMMTDYEFLHR